MCDLDPIRTSPGPSFVCPLKLQLEMGPRVGDIEDGGHCTTVGSSVRCPGCPLDIAGCPKSRAATSSNPHVAGLENYRGTCNRAGANEPCATRRMLPRVKRSRRAPDGGGDFLADLPIYIRLAVAPHATSRAPLCAPSLLPTHTPGDAYQDTWANGAPSCPACARVRRPVARTIVAVGPSLALDECD